MIFTPETLGIIAVVLGVIAIFLGIRFARSKGVDTDRIAKDVAQSIDYAKIILAVTRMKEEHKDRANRILEVAGIATELAAKANVVTGTEEEKELAKKTVNDILRELNIDPTPEEIILIQKTIDTGIVFGEKNTVKIYEPTKTLK